MSVSDVMSVGVWVRGIHIASFAYYVDGAEVRSRRRRRVPI